MFRSTRTVPSLTAALALIGSTLVAVPANARPSPLTDEQEDLVRAARSGAEDAESGSGSVGSRTEGASKCLAKIQAAYQAGLKPETQIAWTDSHTPPRGVRVDPADATTKLITLGDLERYVCRPGTFAELRSRLYGRAFQCCDLLRQIEQGAKGNDFDTTVQLTERSATDCLAAAKELRAAGADDDLSIHLSPCSAAIDGHIPLADVEVKVCGPALVGQKVEVEKAAAALDAQYAPYVKALSGDKKKMARELSIVDGTNWFGKGGKRLKSPADFKRASVWYSYSYDTSPVVPTWDLTGYVFKGDKKAGVTKKSGSGSAEPPSSAFK